MFGGSVCAGADLLPPAGESWHSLVEVRDGNALPLGNPLARGGLGYILRLFSLPLVQWLMGLLQRADEGIGPYGTRKASGYSVGADALIRPPVQAATTAQAARSEAERAEREAAQMRPCTPLTSAPSATGRQLQTCRRPKRARRPAQIGACTDTPTPVARRATAPERANAFLFGPCTARFSFGKTKEKWGVHPAGQAPCGSRIPRGRRSAAPPRLCSSPTTALIRQVHI